MKMENIVKLFQSVSVCIFIWLGSGLLLLHEAESSDVEWQAREPVYIFMCLCVSFLIFSFFYYMRVPVSPLFLQNALL